MQCSLHCDVSKSWHCVVLHICCLQLEVHMKHSYICDATSNQSGLSQYNIIIYSYYSLFLENPSECEIGFNSLSVAKGSIFLFSFFTFFQCNYFLWHPACHFDFLSYEEIMRRRRLISVAKDKWAVITINLNLHIE